MINQQQKDQINKYAELKLAIKDLEKQASELNEEVCSILENNNLGEINLSLGKLSLGSRRTWTYPKEIEDKEKSLKAEKKTAEQIGTADYVEKSYLLFKGNKDE